MSESVLDKFRKGAQKAGIQATAFARDSSTKFATGSRDFVQTFSLPGEAEKSAKILDTFLGMYVPVLLYRSLDLTLHVVADPDHPESALNSIPKAVLQRARGAFDLKCLVVPGLTTSIVP